MTVNRKDQFVDAPEGYEGKNRFMNFHGFKITVGVGFKPFFLNEIERIKNKNESCVVAFAGPPGRGKTYMALRLAQMVDKKFDVNTQVVYDRKQLLLAISEESPLHRGQVLLIDEAQFTMSSRNWADQLQKDLMEQLEAVRARGLIIFIVVLGIDLLDIILRKYVINFMIYLEGRGRGTVYKYNVDRFSGREYTQKLGEVQTLLPGWKQCKDETSCLRCKKSGISKTQWNNRKNWVEEGFVPCDNVRARYEFMKKEFVESKNKASIEKAESVEKKQRKPDKEAGIKTLEDSKANIPTNNKGTFDYNECRRILEKAQPDVLWARDVVLEVKSVIDKSEREKKNNKKKLSETP